MEIVSENSTNWLVQTEDGGTDIKTKASDLNRLLFEYNLYGLLDAGTEIWTHEGGVDEPKVMVIPHDDSEKYTLSIGDNPELVLGEHHKTDLISALGSVHRELDGDSIAPLIELYDRIRSDMVRKEMLSVFANALSEKVEERDDGWFINGHLLLTYEGDFYHPNLKSRQRDGTVVGMGTEQDAYNISTSTTDIQREFTKDGEQRRLTDAEVKFVAKAVWAVGNTPDKT